MKIQWILLASLVWAGVSTAADTPKPALTLVDSTLRMTRGSNDAGTVAIIVQADDFPEGKLPAGQPQIKVLTKEAPTMSDPIFARQLSTTTTGGIWQYHAVVTGLPRQTSAAKKLLLTWGHEASVSVDATITDKDAGTFNWSFPAPPVWNLVDSATIAVPIVVKDVQATNIQLLQSTLARAGETPLTVQKEDLELCSDAEDKHCGTQGPIGPSASKTLYLHWKNPSDGAFSGNVTISCDQKPEGDAIALTINRTTMMDRWEGTGLIAVGVLAYFVVVGLGRYKLAKNSRMEVAALLQQQVVEEQKAANVLLAGAPTWAKDKVGGAFTKLTRLLGDDALKPQMPSLLDPNAKADDFKAYIQAAGLRLEALHVVMQNGVSSISAAWSQAQAVVSRAEADLKEAQDSGEGADKVAEAKKNVVAAKAAESKVPVALDEMLLLADGKNSAADTKTKVDAIVSELGRFVNFAGASALDDEDVRMRLQHVWLSNARWMWLLVIIWLVVTTLTGALAMVWGKAGFGAPFDWGLCLLWGLGLPAAGSHLDQITASDIAPKMGIGISIPKAGG